MTSVVVVVVVLQFHFTFSLTTGVSTSNVPQNV